jgi:putative oxidoreductase
MDSLRSYAAPLGRLLLSALFIWAAVGNLRDMGGTAQYFAHLNVPVPSVTVWIVMLIHLLGGLAILVGFKARWAAIVLAIFCLITAFAIHLPAGDLPNMIAFYKDMAIAGGFLFVFAHGAGMWSVDAATGAEKA